MTNDLAKLIDVIDENAKLISNITTVAKNVIAKNPEALNNSILENVIKANLGESMYDKIRKTYQEFIGT